MADTVFPVIRPVAELTARGLSGSRRAALATLFFALVAALIGSLSGTPSTAAAAGSPPGTSAAAAVSATGPGSRSPIAADDAAVTLDSITPSVVPTSGPLQMTGTVTNTTDQVMRDLNVHPFASTSPINTTRELEVAAESDPELPVGDRISAPGTFDTVAELAPDETATFTVRVPRAELLIPRGVPGVYWIGIHVRGVDDSGFRATIGRARSFIPQIASRGAQKVKTSVVVPIRHAIRRDGDGRISDSETWKEEFSSDGRLSRLLDFVQSSGGYPITVALDPAVLDAAGQLAAGNAAYSLEPSATPSSAGDGGAGGGDDGGSGGGDGVDGDGGSGDHQSATPTDPASDDASEWLTALLPTLESSHVLAMPYGDLDVAAASQHDPSRIGASLRESRRVLDGYDIAGKPAVIPPSGLLDSRAVDDLPDDAQVFLSEESLPSSYLDDEQRPAVMEVSDRRVALIDRAASTGGPGPDDTGTAIAMRQRLLAEAALRSLTGSSDSLLMSLPVGFDPGPRADEFFEGLDQSWLRLRPAGVDRKATPVDIQELTYPQRQADRELSATTFTDAERLHVSASTLDALLVDNEELGTAGRQAAFAATSYLMRDDVDAAETQASAGAAWFEGQLGKVGIDAPNFVILSSDDGPFAPTITNGLDQPIQVSVRVRTQDDVTITAPSKVNIEAGGSQTIQLEAKARSIGVHPVTLVVTDVNGRPTGAEEKVDIRSNSVGFVIWIVLGIGLAALLLAIPFRRWRKRRTAEAARP